MRLFYSAVCLPLFITLSVHAQTSPPFMKYLNDKWVDSLMVKLSLDQKIGQLFMVQAYSNQTVKSIDPVIKLIKDFQVGGIIFMQGGPVIQAKITNQFQKASVVPLLIAIDGETGLGFRLDSVVNYPVQMALGALQDDSLLYRMGYEIGQQLRAIGVHMNMAPVSDINLRADNPIINYRSFGENKHQVARKSWLLSSGMQDAGVLATAKHFPGHGDTKDDSHSKLPFISHNKERLDSMELLPFRYLIDRGIGAIMTGHLQVASLEPNPKIPASLSTAIINNTLKTEMGFKGLVITDAMNMRGVSNSYSSAESTVKALKAGNDMLEIVPSLSKAIEAVKIALKNGEIKEAEIDAKCRKILAVKRWLGLNKMKLVDTSDLYRKLNKPEYLLTKRTLFEQSLTVLKNPAGILPIQQLDTLKIASLTLGDQPNNHFQMMLGKFTAIDHFNIGKTPADLEIDELLTQLQAYNLLIIGIHGLSLYPQKRFGISDQQIRILDRLKAKHAVICYFGNPYSLTYFPNSSQHALIMAYQDDPEVQEMAAQLVFGATSAHGKLPVSVPDQYAISSGIGLRAINRLKYTLPEEVNISSDYLKAKIDSIALLGIQKKAFPGCQVLVAKNGKVIFQSNYGWYDYEQSGEVCDESIYDLASLTKVTAPLPIVMKLTEEKKINLDTPFSHYFTEFKNTDKAGFSFRDVLTHQARFQSSLPFWLEPGKFNHLRKDAFSEHPSERYPTRISSSLYVKKDFNQQIIDEIAHSKLRQYKEYNYSDLGFGILPFVIERLTSEDFESYYNRELIRPLGATTLCFKPYLKFPLSQIAPTETDETFRKETLRGFVHDEMAALFGGVSGNAGLFSSANDLTKIFQMYLQSGYYGGKQYFKPSTVNEFTKVQFPMTANRRALGFDKPNPGITGQKNKFPAADASPLSYGHTGFTGTFVWADPDQQLLFIFLSNRVHPSRRNSLLTDLNIRTAMHQVIYDAIKRGL